MSKISVLGLGSMGSALARTLQDAGHRMTVWNRTTGKLAALVAKGASDAADVASAVRASPVILVCVDNYAVTKGFLSSEDVIPHLSGRTVIQLSTGTPLEARQSALWFNDHGASYLDGAILGGPNSIGTSAAQILFAGSKAAFEQVEPLMACLAGNIRYVGENVRSAAALDLAWLCQRFGLFLGLAHGAYLCESEDVSVGLYATMFPQDDRAHIFAEVIESDEFANPSATLSVWEAALQRVLIQARDAGINAEIPEFVSVFLKKAIAAGYGEQDVAALVKVLRAAS
jgi:3-hydroxyisobutyrate dehydrogenase-like beta-hydroxyacid dehydrogenase